MSSAENITQSAKRWKKKLTEKDYFALLSDIPNVLKKYTYFLIFSVFYFFFFFFFFFFLFIYNPVKSYYSIWYDMLLTW